MNVIEKLNNGLLISDGGTGTVLQEMGLQPGECSEIWNITNPEKIIKLHTDYYLAGSDIVHTNTFGVNPIKYNGSNPQYSVDNLIKCAVNNAKKARENCAYLNKELYIALDIGPFGKMLEPFGDLEFETAISYYAEIVKAGVKYGVDIISIETMNDCYETKAAVIAAKENSNLPIFVTNVYDNNAKLMTGASPEAMVAMLEGLGVNALGINCSLAPSEMLPILKRIINVSSTPVIIKPNAGLPIYKDGVTTFEVDKQTFADNIYTAVTYGAAVVGGCCGTTPEYIKEISIKCKNYKFLPISQKNITVVSSYIDAQNFDKLPVSIGERINPTGKKKMKEALISGDFNYIFSEALSQEENGADCLDVNVGIPDIDEEFAMIKAVKGIQAVCGLPLQIDSSNSTVLEKAARIYNGKPLINSVNAKASVMQEVFPIVKKYGGTVIGLTLDENGIPNTSDQRVKLAQKIIDTAQQYGIDKKDIIIDPLALTVSADNNSALITLETVNKLSSKGIKTSLGVSNISFGLPNREAVNTSFLTLALQNGLSAAIINPYCESIMNAIYAYNALAGLDENCRNYIDKSVKNESVTVNNVVNDLESAIGSGLKDSAYKITQELLINNEPMDIINNHIVPALDKVGIGYENKTVFLPQLLMSAEAAKSAFDAVKEKIKSTEGKCNFLIATVKGDIHDIGKNIVKALLQNYGYNVIDLGKDVNTESIVKAVGKYNATFLGLSALMTTTLPAMEETVKAVKKIMPQCKVIVGGAVLTNEFAEKIGADFYAMDAMAVVRYCEKENK